MGVPKDFGSTKNVWETNCHVLSYQHQSVKPPVLGPSVPTRKVVVERHGCGLGLDVSCEEESGSEFLLIEDVGPGPVELWNLSHPGEIMVQAGDRILEVNGVSGDANAMLCAVQASDTVELTMEFFLSGVKRELMPNSPASTAWSAGHRSWPFQQAFPASASQMCPELAMSCQAEICAPQMQMVPAPVPQMQMVPTPVPQMQTQMQTPKVYIHSGPPKIFIHSGPPIDLLKDSMVLG